MSDDPLKKYFPFPEYRAHQKQDITKILYALNDPDCDNIIYEAPVGAGKSVVGATIAQVMKSSFYLTIQKILMTQIANDFNWMALLKGRNAYECWWFNEFMQRSGKKNNNEIVYCDQGKCVQKNKTALAVCTEDKHCPYINALLAAENAPHTLFNFSSFLYQTFYAHRFQEPRSLMIIDEVHNCESQIMNFVDVSITEDDAGDFPNKLKRDDVSVDEYLEHFEKIKLIETIINKQDELIKILESRYGMKYDDFDITSLDKEDVRDAKATLKQIDNYKSIINKYEYMMGYVDKVECIADYDDFNRKVSIKPLYANYHTPRLLLNKCRKHLFMSATILNKDIFSENIGIDPKRTTFIQTPHPFPKENRPIYINDYAGSMKFKNKKKTMPKMIKKIESLMKKHKGEKGIIHCQSFALMDEIYDGVDFECQGRLIHQRMFKRKDDLLLEHANKPGSVIIAPAMHEGLDLRGDLSRFQILCKIPYPNSKADKQLRIRSDRNWNYYLWITALKIVQSYGRSVRSKTDYAATYILDSDFDSFFNQCDRAKLLPEWFIEALIC